MLYIITEYHYNLIQSIDTRFSAAAASSLVQAVQKGWKESHTLSAVASWQRARENCQREVQEIIDRCRAEGHLASFGAS